LRTFLLFLDHSALFFHALFFDAGVRDLALPSFYTGLLHLKDLFLVLPLPNGYADRWNEGWQSGPANQCRGDHSEGDETQLFHIVPPYSAWLSRRCYGFIFFAGTALSFVLLPCRMFALDPQTSVFLGYCLPAGWYRAFFELTI